MSCLMIMSDDHDDHDQEFMILADGQKVGHFLITIQKSFKVIINQLWT